MTRKERIFEALAAVRALDHFQVRDPWWLLFASAIRAVLSSWWKHRKCITNHDAPVWEDEDGNLMVTEIAWPETKSYPIEEWVKMKLQRGSKFIVVRPRVVEVALSHGHDGVVEAWNKTAREYWRSLEGAKYPLRDIYIIYRNTSLKPLKWVGWVNPDKAHVYCTEGNNRGYEESRIDIGFLSDIELPTPWHNEEADRQGIFNFITGHKPIWEAIVGQSLRRMGDSDAG